ncbi:MAG: hypothetical protein ABGW50_04895, partial [Thermococcus sp.]
ILIYIEHATFPFFAQYDVRPNFKFVEYLEYPVEVFNMLIADFKLEVTEVGTWRGWSARFSG